jgi:hypothetical protein
LDISPCRRHLYTTLDIPDLEGFRKLRTTIR